MSVLRGLVFICKNVARFANLVPQFLLFVNFDFSYFFFVFFKNKQYQRRLDEENK